MEINIRFGGFYQSVHSEFLEAATEGEEYSPEQWKELRKIYIKAYVRYLNEQLNTEFMDPKLLSPRFYNFETDEIVVQITKKDALNIMKYANEFCKNELKRDICDKLERKEGYIPLYTENTILKKENREVFLSGVLETIIECLDDEGEWSQYFDQNHISERLAL